jgi:hypothetical protein
MPSAAAEPVVSAPAPQATTPPNEEAKAALDVPDAAREATSEPPLNEHRQTLPAPEGISTAPAPAPEPSPTIPAEERASAKLTVAPEQPAPDVEAPKPASSAGDEPAADAPASAKNGAASSKSGKSKGTKSSPGKSSAGKSKPGTRRSAGEDLISELFEQMHELHFMRDIASGSEFVLSVLRQMLPSEAILVQVFDINSRNFVVVRAFPDVREALLLRTADSDPVVREVMRRPTSLRVADAGEDGRFGSEVWRTLGVTPRVAMCGPVRQGGRYLGLIQLANPLGGKPFHDAEANALDYVCQQFAEFVANRPIVLEVDTVMPRR